MPVTARHLIIQGRVQGVFYRNWAVALARDLSLSGWVRNRRDASVEMWVEGAAEAIEQFIAQAHEGPPAARVLRVIAQPVETEGFVGFEKRPTA
ncbi:acylphosphatase [Sphingobium sp. AN641]|uniref:acylphosphatase n=1 Tax=Sphingobium sp. AN641 TaxID=3133443 RepID=UPI0030C26E49